MLDRADPVRDGPEVADAQVLLALHAERAVVGGDHLQVVGAQRLPHVLLVPLGPRAQRRRAHPLGALEARRAQLLLEAEVQVLRARLAEHVLAVVPRPRQLRDGLLGAHVHHVQRGVRDVGQHDRPVRGLLLELPGARDAVVVRVGLALRDELRGQHVDRRPVLRVHHGEQPEVGGLLHGPQDLRVVGVEDPRVGHEQLVAGHPLGDQALHRLERVLVDAADDLVEAVVDRAVPGGLVVPGAEPVHDPLARALHGEVDDRRRPAPGRGPGAGLERVATRWCRRTAAPCGCARRCRPGSRTCRSRR